MGDVNQLKMGKDPLIDFDSFLRLSNHLLNIPHEKGISLLSYVKKLERSNLMNQPWIVSTYLEIRVHLAMEWPNYISAL